MLSYSSPDIRPETASAPAVRATRRITGLTDDLAAELTRFAVADLGPADVQGLVEGVHRTAAALTRILDQLRELPELTQPEHELGLPRHHTVRSELEQAAAAAEDLQAAAESLCRLLPTESPGSPQ